MIRSLVLALALVTSAVWASDPVCTQYRTQMGLADSGWQPTKEAACAALSGKTWAEITLLRTSAPVLTAALDGPNGCKGTRSQTVMDTTTKSDWTSGFTSQTVTCPNQCTANKSSVINWTVGYTRTPNISLDSNWKTIDAPNKIPDNGIVCNSESKCLVSTDLYHPDAMAFQSQYPTAQGTYRLSIDVPSVETGQTCTPSDLEIRAISKSAPVPPCPGAIGEVNGVKGCYGTAENPSRNDKDVSSVAPKEPGNPAAGTKPGTGEGSGTGGTGRTPGTGNGGPGGGPGGAAGTGAGSGAGGGTVTKPSTGKEQANCGAPGQPKCGIDETGTPEKLGDDKYNSKLDQYKTDSKNAGDQIKGEGDGVFSAYSTFFAAPALQACEPVELPTVAGVSLGSISKQCDVVEGVRSVMAYIWALVGMWVCLGWVKRATN